MIIFTDHKPLLRTLVVQRKTTTCLVEKISVYDLDLRYKKVVITKVQIFSITKDNRFLRILELQQSDEK